LKRFDNAWLFQLTAHSPPRHERGGSLRDRSFAVSGEQSEQNIRQIFGQVETMFLMIFETAHQGKYQFALTQSI
jgi:hypothetical protein